MLGPMWMKELLRECTSTSFSLEITREAWAKVDVFNSTHTAAFADQLFGGSNSEDVAAVSSTNGSAGVEFDKLVTNDVNVRKEPEEDYAQLVQDQQKTISLLVSEKNSLAEEMERYRDIESREYYSLLSNRSRNWVFIAELVAKDNELRQCKQSFTSLDAKLNSVNEELAKRVQELHERDAESSSLKSRLRDQVIFSSPFLLSLLLLTIATG